MGIVVLSFTYDFLILIFKFSQYSRKQLVRHGVHLHGLAGSPVHNVIFLLISNKKLWLFVQLRREENGRVHTRVVVMWESVRGDVVLEAGNESGME